MVYRAMFEVYVGDEDIQEVQRHAVGVSRPGVSAIGKRLLLLLSCRPSLASSIFIRRHIRPQ